MPDQSRITQLIVRQFHQTLSEEEMNELEEWSKQDPANQEFLDRHIYLGNLQKSINQLFKDALHEDKVPNIKDKPRRRYTWGVAILSLVMALSGALVYTYISDSYIVDTFYFARMPVGQALAEPVSHACLTLLNGKKMVLDQLPMDSALLQDGWEIMRTGNHTLTYLALDQNTCAHVASGFHTYSIPNGESWHIILPDGSKVQLNAGSSLSYMVNHSSDDAYQRLATLQGEAFFDIAPDANRPFAVKTATGMITVLGTSFNLRDYANEDSFRATLVQGAIQVKYKGNSMSLRPGEAACVNKTTEAARIIRGLDVKASLEWRSDYFDFTSKNMRQILEQAVDWYRLNGYRIKGKVDTTTPGLLGAGHISKDLPLEVLLRGILPGNVSFCVNDNVLFISQKP